MALLADDTFYTVTFVGPGSSVWTSFTPTPSFPAPVAKAIFNGTPTVIYVATASVGQFLMPQAQVFGFDDVMIASSTELTGHTLAALNGTFTRWCKDASDNVYMYDSNAGFLQQYTYTNVLDFRAFLPS